LDRRGAGLQLPYPLCRFGIDDDRNGFFDLGHRSERFTDKSFGQAAESSDLATTRLRKLRQTQEAETKNVADDHPELVEKLKQKLQERLHTP